MSARDELRGTLSNTVCNASNYTKRAQPYLLGSDMSAVLDKTADALLAAGYRKPMVIGYVVISRDGRVIGVQFSDREAAQARADEWTNDCKTAGIDWDYRVAEITEAQA